ncbi:MAG: DUF2281 domain-containing protein [Desulfobacter postgatei]|jgi:hypothetical protein|uniref:DUF2281 domain-containing protein n=1 Tax=Desulfobacter postgatei 2ac9 TaxID=879212 RepID=I5B6I0_9BACT|nr:DUF2281 domain-containing protein [Desulfobacter postgatei]EIM65093.1 Protein of unknown function (DUF2281) [Desulfobacter postgatei 2ac9]MDD4274306.1 DUF2281 domain-containing protein [Desulfobacter postgatei]
MATAQKIYEKALKLPEPLAQEILDFIGYIETKYGLKDTWVDELINAQEPVMDQIWSNSEDDVWNNL